MIQNRLILAVIGMALLIFGIWIGSSGTNSIDQSAAISQACSEYDSKEYSALAYDFMLIARHNPAYINAAYGAKLWATYKGDLTQAYSGLINDNGASQQDVKEFFTLCS